MKILRKKRGSCIFLISVNGSQLWLHFERLDTFFRILVFLGFISLHRKHWKSSSLRIGVSISVSQRPKRGGFFTPRPASSFYFTSPPRLAPLFQGISINGIDTKGRNREDFLLPASPRPVSTFYFSSPPRHAPIPRPVSVSGVSTSMLQLIYIDILDH